MSNNATVQGIDVKLPVEIVDLEEVSSHPNLLVFAKSGAGKTVLGASDDNVLILNTEPEGTLSAQRSNTKGSNVKEWPIRSVADMDKAYDWLLTLAEKGKEIPFKWVVIDSLTEYQEMDMKELLDQGVSKKPSKDAYVPEWQDYLKNQKRIVRRVKEFNQLPVNILYTCLVTNHTDPEGNEFMYPALHGKGYGVATVVCSQMTSYGYLFVKPRFEMVDGKKRKTGNDRFVVWEDRDSMMGKDRTTVLAPFTKNLTLKQLREKMEAKNVQAKKVKS